MPVQVTKQWPGLATEFAEPREGAAAQSNLFLDTDWWHIYGRWFCNPESIDLRVFLFCDEPQAKPRAVLPMFAKDGFLQGCTNYYSPIYEFVSLVDVLPRSQYAKELVMALSGKESDVFAVRMQPMDRNSTAYSAFLEALRDQGWLTREFFCFANWFLPNRYGSYKEYLMGRPSSLRNTLKRKSRRLLRDSGDVAIFDDPADVSEYFGAFQRIYQASWKPPESHPGFIRDLAETLALSKKTRLGVVIMNGLVVAAQLWFVSDGAAYIYKLAHDNRFSEYSPGTILTGEMIRMAMDRDGVSEIDFLMGDDDYKQLWMTDRRERWGIQAYSLRTARGRLWAGVEVVKDRLRPLVKR